jgi:molybdate transport system substrate-binding protein
MFRSRIPGGFITRVLGGLGALGVAGVASAAIGPGAAAGGEVAARPTPEPLLVFAAASLTDALGEVDRAFTARTHIEVRASFAASSVLAKQIEAGAPADVFFSADLDWMDYLDARKLLRPGSRHDVVSNRLVLIAAADSGVSLKLAHGVDFGPALGPDGKLATGDPGSVPVGKYAAAALRNLGVWDQVSPRIVGAENVRAALAFVARGEAPLGIVYRTDALAEKRVRVVAEFPADSHPPITYPVALTLHAGPEAAQFEDFIRSKAAAAIFRKYGFEPLH